MEKFELRAVIKFFYLKRLTPKEIITEITQVLGDNAVSYSTVKKWLAEFKGGRQSTDDEPRSGRPSTSITDDHVNQAEAIVYEDRRVTVRHVATILKISVVSSDAILTGNLRLKSLGKMGAKNVETRAKAATC